MESNGLNMDSVLLFFVNGKKIIDGNVDPSMSLLTYLREKLYYSGTKMGCNEGGCGACTVMVSKLDNNTRKIKHYSVNACLAPIGTMHGMSVTTVEGIGSTKRLHPVQERLAKAHGSQCGFCSPGFVMSMYTLLRNNPEPTMEEIEENLVGNLCRCTGYRPILEGFRTFSKEFVTEGCGRADCCQLEREGNDGSCQGNKIEKSTVLFDPNTFSPYDSSQEIIFPPELLINSYISSQNIILKNPAKTFFRVCSLQGLLNLKDAYPEAVIVIGNTKIGIDENIKHHIYPTIIHPVNVPELTRIEVKESYIEIGAGVPVSDIEQEFKKIIKEIPEFKTKIIAAIIEMLRWFAGRQIKNVASLGGSIMTGLSNSDFNSILMAAGARLLFRNIVSKKEIAYDHNFYVNEKNNLLKSNFVLVNVKLLFTNENEVFRSYKQGRRRGKDLALVNAAMKVDLDFQNLNVREIFLAFGGVSSTTVMAKNTMEATIFDRTIACRMKYQPLASMRVFRLAGMNILIEANGRPFIWQTIGLSKINLKGNHWDEKLLDRATSLLIKELRIECVTSFSMAEYKTGLVASFFFKFYLSVCEEIHKLYPKLMSPLKKYEEKVTRSYEKISPKSMQFFQNVPEGQEKIDPVGRPIGHVSALKQTTGEATYTDDIPPFKNELFAALVLSSRAHAKILQIDSSEALKLEGVEGFFTAKDMLDEKNLTGYVTSDDEEVFASKEVRCVGQIIGVVVATIQSVAQKAAQMIIVQYEDLSNPIFTIEEAIKANSVWDPLLIESGNVEEGFKKSKHILEGEVRTGGQEHFYLETNTHIAVPYDDCEIELMGSLQSPLHTQTMVAKALGIDANKVYMKVKRAGGGFGGKESRHTIIVIAVAVAAMKTKRPVRIVLNRQDDMLITGGRHPLTAKWKIGFEDDGKLNAFDASYYFNAGCSLDVSQLVMGTVLLNANNAYQIDNLRVKGQCCKTNLASNTAFRSSGNPQTLFVIESALSKIAEYLHIDPVNVREINMYGKSSYITHYGQEIKNSTVKDCWNQVISSSDYENRITAVQDFNSKNAYRKRGISAMPIKFGIGANFPTFHQAGALVMVYLDGSVLLSHGGVELGQGLHTKMLQIASRVLEIPMVNIYIPDTATNKVPNASPTVASLSSDLNGMAVLEACNIIKKRLEPFKAKMPDGNWKDWVSEAYSQRVSLSATGFYKMPNIVEYKFDGKPATPYSYFSFGAAVSEVEIDCLTGDHMVLRTDIVMDVGKSLNPAIDIGQIEGAFLQGYGLFTLEQLLYSSSGDLLTKGPETYKIPCVFNIPREFNVTLLRNSENERAVYSSKAVGEPPFLSGISVFLAIREAVKAARKEEELYIPFDAPATSERIRMACDDWITQKINYK